jgi:hypothetical protein
LLLLVLVLQHPLLVLHLVKVLLLKTLGVLVRIPVLLLVTSLVSLLPVCWANRLV